jgi:hypothetical protein
VQPLTPILPPYQTAKGWLAPAERDLLVRLAAAVPADGHLLNIGIEYGASLVCLRHGNSTAGLVGIDLDATRLASVLWEPLQPLRLLEDDSGQVAPRWTQALDLLFVDGDHSFAGVLRDTVFCDHVVVGGVVVFHDCYDWGGSGRPHGVCPEVTQAVDVWLAKQPTGRWQEQPWVITSRVFRRTA